MCRTSANASCLGSVSILLIYTVDQTGTFSRGECGERDAIVGVMMRKHDARKRTTKAHISVKTEKVIKGRP
jgi:hypothetical protein